MVVGIAILLLGIGTLIRERGTSVSWLFTLLTVIVGFWLILIAHVIAAVDANVALRIARIEHIGVHFIPAILFHFAVLAMGGYERHRKKVWLSWILSALFVAATARGDVLIGGVYHYWWGYYPRYGWSNVPFLLFFGFSLCASLREYWSAYKSHAPGTIQHRRARAFLLAFGVGYLASVDYIPAYGIDVYPFGYIPVLAFLILSSRAIWRYHLVDITPAFAANEIIHTMSEALLVLDQEGRIRVVNPGACQLFEYSSDELLGQSFATILGNRILPSGREILENGGNIRIQEYVFWPTSGEKKVLSISASVMHDRAHGVLATVCILRDITERKKAEERIRQEAARAEALRRVASRLNGELELEALLNAVCEETTRALNVPAARVSLYDEEEDAFRTVASVGLSSEFEQRARGVPRAVYEEYARRMGPVIANPDVQAIPGLPDAALYAELDIRTLVVATLARNGELIGSLNVNTFGEVRHFDDEELALLQGLADQAAQAITNARLFEQAQRRLRRLQALNAIDRAITARLELPETLDVVLEQVTTHLQVDAANILLLDRQSQVLEYAAGRGFRSQAVQKSRVPLGEGYSGRVALERRTISIPDLNRAEGFVQAPLLAEEEFVAYCGLPLVAEGEVLGVLGAFHRSPLDLEEEWQEFLEALAFQAAIAIDSAGLYAETRRLLEKTREQAQQVRQIVDTMPEGVLLLNVQGQVILANPLGQTYLEQLAEARSGDVLTQLGGRPLAELLQPVDEGHPWYELTCAQPEQIFEM
ncbi:MAG TPA: GAF domain-containing protein, partial [Candidatus Sulfomarinibacteraceae bacterium]|nr:GAF domain-containing protein [Candidatus Sulfomarinibacteraceae bacterium]